VARFTQAEVTRAVRGSLAAGVAIGRVEIAPDGCITIYAAGETPLRDNSWDDQLDNPSPLQPAAKSAGKRVV